MIKSPKEFLRYPTIAGEWDRSNEVKTIYLRWGYTSTDTSEVFAVIDDSTATSRNLVCTVSIGATSAQFTGSNRIKDANDYVDAAFKVMCDEKYPDGLHIVENGLYKGNVLLAWVTEDKEEGFVTRISSYHEKKFGDFEWNKAFESFDEAMAYLTERYNTHQLEQASKPKKRSRKGG